jgi:DNA-binding transcriptional LysR family regulator
VNDMIELRHLRVFQMVAELRHFSRAAERLQTTQPSVSRTIRDLEASLGVALLERTSKRVALSEAGNAFLKEANAIIKQFDAAKAAARLRAQGIVGSLNLMISPFTGLTEFPSRLRSFRDARPTINVRIQESCSVAICDAVVEGRCDVGFVIRNKSYGGLEYNEAYVRPINVILPENHRLGKRSFINLEELAKEMFIFTNHSSEPQLLHTFMDYCQDAEFEPRIAFELDQIETTLAFVASGHGIAILPDLGDMDFRGIVQIPLEPKTMGGIAVIWNPSCQNPCRDDFLRHLLNLGPRRAMRSE